MTTSKWLMLQELMDDMDLFDVEKCRDIAKRRVMSGELTAAYESLMDRLECSLKPFHIST